MTNTPPYSFCAGAAIAAVLALGSTPTLAQEAAPVIDVPPAVQAAPPVTAPVDAPAPTASAPATPVIVLPPELTAPPLTAEAPVASAPAEQTSTARPARTRTQPRTAARTNSTPPAAETTPVAEAPVAVPPAVTPIDNPVTLSGAVSEPVAVGEPAPVAEPASTQDNSALLGGLMAGLVILGAGAAFALRRKRRTVSEPDDRELAAEAPAYDTGYTSAVVPLATSPTIEPARAEVDAEPSRGAAPAVGWMEAAPNAGVDFSMPAGPVPTGEAREELLRRMVAAAPDAANPFRSTVARRKRARIILQTREHEQKQDATRPFDFRTYQSPQPSAAATRETESADA